MEEKPPTKKEFSAEAEHAPEPRHIEPAPIVAVAGVYFRRPVWKKDGSLVWQKFRGHPSRGAELISLTRSTIAFCDGEPLEVVQTVIARLPEAVLAKCTNASADPVEISRKIERHLPKEGLRETIGVWLASKRTRVLNTSKGTGGAGSTPTCATSKKIWKRWIRQTLISCASASGTRFPKRYCGPPYAGLATRNRGTLPEATSRGRYRRRGPSDIRSKPEGKGPAGGPAARRPL